MRLDSTSDPLIDPVLALIKAAVNAEFVTMDPQFGSDEVVKTTHNYPIDLTLGLGDMSMPALGCHRIRSRAKRFSVVHTDYINTLKFTYITPACAREQIGGRWPLLERVWRTAVDVLFLGHHPAYLSDAPVLINAGVINVDLNTATKQELYAEQGDYAFPAFFGEIEVTWRASTAEQRTAALYPFLSARGKMRAGPGVGPPDLTFDAYTPLGLEERDAQPFEQESELGT